MATIWSPISNSVPQFSKNAGGAAAADYYLKFYLSGTTTPTSMATDSTGGTLLDKCKIDSLGYPVNGSDEVFIPHIDQAYKLALYTNATDADNNATGSAAWVVDGLTFVSSPITAVATLIEEQTAASDGQALFTLTNITYTPGAKNLGVYRNGTRLPQSSYTETSSTSITLNASEATSIVTGDEFEFIVNERDVSTATTPASNVTYTPAGTGAVVTDVKSYLDDKVVKNFDTVADMEANATAYGILDGVYLTTKSTTWIVTTTVTPVSLGGGLYAKNLSRDIVLTTMGLATPDLNFAKCLSIAKDNPDTRIFIDGNHTFNDNYTIDYRLHLTSVLNNASMRFAGTGEFIRLKQGSDGSVIKDIDFNGNDFNGNPFNSKTLIAVRTDDANDMSQVVQKLHFENLRFQWCDLALFLGHASSSSFNDIRAIQVVTGVRLFGVCLENSFLRPNILAYRYAVEFKRNSVTAPQGSGDVPQGNYFVGGTLVTQDAQVLRDFGGFTDATIASDTAVILADCAFDYGFVNTWIEGNLRHSVNNQHRIGFIIDFVQDEQPKYFQGAMGFSRCRLNGNKVRFSAGASSFANGGTFGTMFNGCDIALFRDDVGDASFAMEGYGSDVVFSGNNFVVKSGNQRVITFSNFRDAKFSGNFVLYEDNIATAYPSGPSVAHESPVFVSNCERITVSDNDFDYITAANVDFITLQGTNTDLKIRSNSSPLDDVIYTDGALDFYRKNGLVKVTLRTASESYTNGQVIASLPTWLTIKNSNEQTTQQTREFNIYGSSVSTYNRLTYDNGDIRFYGTSVNNMRCSFDYDIF